MAVMGRDDIVVGSNPSIRAHLQARVEARVQTQTQAQMQAQASGRPPVDRQERRRPALCGAMSQQRDNASAQSMPQKLVQLVGCRDPKVRASLKR
jgi:hypothetical protein